MDICYITIRLVRGILKLRIIGGVVSRSLEPNSHIYCKRELGIKKESLFLQTCCDNTVFGKNIIRTGGDVCEIYHSVYTPE
jgi:hypothetical protein